MRTKGIIPIDVPTDWKTYPQGKAFLKYEKDILSSKIPCPYKAEFINSEWESLGIYPSEVNGVTWSREHFKCTQKGEVVLSKPITLTPNGVSKIDLSLLFS